MLQIAAIIISALALVANVLMGFLLLRLRNGQERLNRMEDGWNRKLDGAIQTINELTSKLVDERFRAFTHEINNHVNAFVLTIDAMKERLKDGDVELSSLSERDQKIELAVAGKFDAIKDFIRENLAGKEDLKSHQENADRRFDRLGERVEELARVLAVTEDRMNRGGRKPNG